MKNNGAIGVIQLFSTPVVILTALIKKKIKFSLYLRKFRWDRLQSHKWLTASSYMVIYLHISSYIRKPFLLYDFATDPIWISLHMGKILYSFFSVCSGFLSVYKCQSWISPLVHSCVPIRSLDDESLISLADKKCVTWITFGGTDLWYTDSLASLHLALLPHLAQCCQLADNSAT